MKQSLGKWLFKEYISSLVRGAGGDYFGPGSENAMVTGEGFIRAFRGVGAVPGAESTASRLYFMADQEFAGLGSAGIWASGSVFLVRDLLSFIGTTGAPLCYKGVTIPGVTASDILSFIKQTGTDFIPGANTGPFQAGHAQPSPPLIYPHDNPSPGQYPINGTVAVKIWRVSNLTGQTSLASLPSNVLTLTNQSVVVKFPLKDFNGQTHFGIGVPKIGFDILGVFYELPTNLYGEVPETTIAYSRFITGASILNTENKVNITDPDAGDQFSSADIGRRILIGRVATGATMASGTNVVNITDPDAGDRFSAGDVGRRILLRAVDGTVILDGTITAFNSVTQVQVNTTSSNGITASDAFVVTFDTWITAINTALQAQVNNTNSTGATISGTGMAVQAVDGITRAIEISWTNGALLQQNLVPDKAFPPSPGQFAGSVNDTVWLDAEGIIFVGEPNELGSFPPDNAIFANERAVQYLPGGDGMLLRFGKHSFGVVTYVGGRPALEYQEIWHDLGITLPQNVARGSAGRLLLWLGRPAALAGMQPDYSYGTNVIEFATWDAAQTQDMPICIGYDGVGEYEVWCLGQTVMAMYVPKSAWCAPINLAGKINGNIVAAFTHRKKLYLTARSIDGLTLTRYQFDVGTGSVMKVQTSDIRPNGYGATITEVNTQGRVDNTAQQVKIELISNYNDAAPVLLYQGLPPRVGIQDFIPTMEPNVIDSKQHAIRLTLTSTGGDAGWDFVESKGEMNEVRTPA